MNSTTSKIQPLLAALPALPALLALASLTGAGCDDIDTFIPRPEFGGPAGIIEGTVTYTGPPPCIQGGRFVGAAAILAFNTLLLPPPDGLGTSAASLDVVPGDELFAGVRSQLGYSEGCPPPGTPNVTVSASWSIAPLPAGTYQIRGFYDLDGDFDPIFSIANLPTQGDIGGGAITNAAAVLAGAKAEYRAIPLGVDGRIPEQGARVSGVAVTLALPLPFERPVFHVAEALAPTGNTANPGTVEMASDFQFNTFSPAAPADTEASFLRLRLAAGVPADERDDAARSPFFFPVGEGITPTLFYARQDVNGDGVITPDDHIPDSDLIPSLTPISVFSKLVDGPVTLTKQTSPAVILQGITLYKTLTDTVALTSATEVTDPVQPEAIIAVRPAALCLHPANPALGGVLVVPHFDDSMGNVVIGNTAALEESLSRQFGRTITVQQGCLPEGNYAINLVYGTGQAWSLPNEAGVCAALEESNGNQCGTRRRLTSQNATLRVVAPTDPAHCGAFPTPPICFP
ncbi:hypothetical protein [Chondromyces apiculatus]|uniref:EF-hand domain-containing protein n=1 Tax=Chondromyces apiculatus DSM 436 TaxID=1192034 RepID=A0A017SZ24_9BACT|nr:hypothetical protein [Chondromyces apiculatus]EYF02244.1 Hypothetical protein CAP_7316 [Chondromyces apiculatus DSM 436]